MARGLIASHARLRHREPDQLSLAQNWSASLMVAIRKDV
jgi:hypothetical protein